VLALGALTTHSAWRNAPPPGVAIWVTTNGVHTGLVLPRKTPDMDWDAFFPSTATRSPSLAQSNDMLEVGWGNRRFYLDVPNWSDLRATTAIRAISGLDSAALHIQYTQAPEAETDSAVRLTLTPEAYRRLIQQIRNSAQLDANNQPVPIPGHHYDDTDAFFEAKGHYSLFNTCNEWVRTALSEAGVRVPLWSPLDKPLLWQLRRIPTTPVRASTPQPSH
jgi:uncharacterized protein (TIGR02117 family)